MKIKKTAVLWIAVMLVYVICACAKQTDAPKSKETPSQSLETLETLKYYYEYQKQKIYIAQKIEEAVSILGGGYEYFEAPSCAFDGLDMFYYYQNLTIMANEVDGQKIVTGIYFQNDTVATPEGIRITSLYADVLEQYGSGYAMNGASLEYSEGSTLFTIDIRDGKAAAIKYEYK